MLFGSPLEPSVHRALLRRGPPALAALDEVAPESALAAVSRAAAEADPSERAIAAEEAVVLLRERLVGRLLWLRVMAPAASGLGLAGAAVQAGWARHPPGLLALDPDRVLGMAMSAGATSLALGIAGSTTALGALFFLRRRASTLVAEAQRVARHVRDLPPDAWTPAAR